MSDSRRAIGVLAVSAVLIGAYFLLPSGLPQAIVYDGLALVAAAAAFIGARRRPVGERAPWRWISLAFTFFFVGDFIWDVYELRWHRESPIPSYADFAYVAAYIALIIGAVALLRRSGRTDFASPLLDAGIVAIGMAIVCWEPLLLRAGEGSTAKAFVAGIYPVGDIAVAAILVTVVVGRRFTSAGYMLIGGLLSLAVADVAVLILSRTDSYNTGDWPDLLFMLGPIVMGAAALAPDAGRLLEAPLARHDRKTSIVLTTGALFAVPFGLIGSGTLSTGDRLAGIGLRLVFLALVAGRLLRLAVTEERARDILATTSTRLMTVVENSQVAVAYTTDDAVVVEWNSAAEELFGYSRQDIVGTNFLDRFGLRERSTLWRDSQAVTEDILPMNLRGKRVLVALRREAVRRFGRGTGYVLFASDATRDVLAEGGHDGGDDEITPVVERLGGVLHEAVRFDIFGLYAIEDGAYRELVSLVATGNVVHSHPGWHARRGQPTPQGLQRLMNEPLIVVNDARANPGEVERFVLAAGDLRSAILVPLRRESSVHSVLLVGFTAPNAVTPELVDLVDAMAPLVSRAVRRMMVIEHEREAAVRLEELEALRETLVRVVSSEVVDGRAGDSSSRVAQFANDLVEVAQAEAVGFPCTVVNIDAADSLIRTAAKAAAADRIDDVMFDLGAPIPVYADPARLRQIVSALVANACRCSAAGTPIEIESGREADMFRLSIRHQGGRPPSALDRPFDQNRAGGASVGLYLTRGIVEAHGGRVVLEPAMTGSTRLVVHLPLTRPARVDVAAGQSAT